MNTNSSGEFGWYFSLRMAIHLMLAALLCISAPAQAVAQDIKIGVTYVCNGEKIFAENCNMRDTSDASTCMMGHPDTVMPNGLMKYTYMTRGDLKKLLPTCTQPSAKQVAAADAFQKRQQALYDANVAKSNAQMNPQVNAARTQGGGGGLSPSQISPPKNAEEREMRRCVSSGRLPSSCTGNSLLGMFGQMISQVLPSAGQTPGPGPTMAGVFQGAGNWRLDFIDGGVLVNCSFLSPNQESYSLKFADGRTVLTIDTRPKPLVLTFRADGSIVGPPGPVTIDGVVAAGSSGGGMSAGHTESHDVTTHERVNSYEINAGNADRATNTGGGTYDLATTTTQSTYVPGTYTAPQTTFAPRRATCPAINLTSKGAGVGVQTLQTDLLKSMFGGDKGPATPPGIRMHGIFAAASTGFSVEFFPESAILGCGPDVARAYPYTVETGTSGSVVKIAASDHPLTLAFRPDGSLDPGSAAPYQVHGRIVTGQNDNDDFTFAPMEQTCNLAVLGPSKTIPSGGGVATTMLASAAGTGAGSGGGLSMPGATLGNATLSVVSGFPAQPGAPNPLASKPYTLLRDSFANVVAKAGVAVPAGTSAYKVFGMACGTRSPDCQKIADAIKASAASAARADANGSATLPGVLPGTYYLMVSTVYQNQPITWGQAVQLKSGANSIMLDQRNATPMK